MAVLRFLQRWAATVFALDLRSLGLFRIGLGVVVVVDALVRLMDVEIFYSDLGLRPRAPLLAHVLHNPSLYLLNGSTAFATALLCLTVLCGLTLALGYRTRVVAVATWLLVLSVQHRNLYITTGADGTLLLMTMMACVLPVGARFSVDARHPSTTPSGLTVATGASAALVLQLIVIYLFNVINKTGPSWRDGTAVLRALHLDQHATPLGHLLLDHAAWLSPLLTFGTLVVEFSAVLLLVPIGRDRIRAVIVAAMWMLHIGLGTTMYLGLFSPVCMVAWLAVLPTSLWSWRPLAALEARAPAPKGPKPPMAWIPATGILVVVALQFAVNVAFTTKGGLPRLLAAPAGILAVDQKWRMFANPSPHDGWFVIPGTLASGEVVDLFRGGAPVSWEKPRYVAHLYKNARWRKLMMNNSNEDKIQGRREHARYLCFDWNRSHSGDDRLVSLTMDFMLEKTRKDYKPPTATKQPLLQYTCPD